MPRFSGAERAAHWVHAGAFFGLLATGAALYLPDVAGTLGSRGTLKTIHLTIAAGWACALLVIVATSDRSALRQTARDIDSFDADDVRWLTGRRSPQGRFNAGQKLHAVIQAAFAVLFAVSGLLLLLAERDTLFRLPGTIVLHDGLTAIALMLVAAHLYLALLWPRTRPSLRGMVHGEVRSDFATAHHAKWTPASTATTDSADWTSPLTWILLTGSAAVAVLAVLALS